MTYAQRLRTVADEFDGQFGAQAAVKELRAIAAELEAQQPMNAPEIPDCWQLVPKVPTEKMHQAAVRTAVRCAGNDDFPPRVYAAMLAAAPSPDEQPGAPA